MQLNRQDVFMTRANQVCGNWQRKAVISRIQSQRLGRLYPAKLKGFRHEFESMDSVHDGELEKHLVAAHHAGARPTWTGTRPPHGSRREQGVCPDFTVRKFAEAIW